MLGSGLGGLADDARGRGRDPVRASCPAGPPRPRRAMSGGCCSAASPAARSSMLQGRFHLYEGNDPGLVVQPVLLFGRLGARARRPHERGRRPRPGVRAGHADGHPRPPQPDRPNAAASGRTPTRIGPRFPDLTDAWSPRLRGAPPRGRPTPRASSSPRASTPACSARTTRPRPRSGCSRTLGGHAVGMSTVLECIAARWAGLEVCGVSLVTNAGAGYTRRAADPRGGPRRRRRGRPAPRARHPALRRGPAAG